MHSRPARPTTTIARTIGTLAAALWTVPLVATLLGADDPGTDGPGTEGVGVGILAVANIAAVAIAWHNPRLGGLLLLGTGAVFAAFAIVTAARNHWLAVAVSGGPFLLAGVLFVIASAGRADAARRRHTSRSGARMAP